MQTSRHRNSRTAADTTGFMLGAIIAVLAVLDLMIWASLYNVPNPISKRLLPQAAKAQALQPVTFAGGKTGVAQPALLTGAPPDATPRPRIQ